MPTRFRSTATSVLTCVGVFVGMQAAHADAPDEQAAAPVELAEVIVTAQKRSERLEDVPVPVTVLAADTLAEQDQNRLQDYFEKVPGLNLTQVGNGEQSLAI